MLNSVDARFSGSGGGPCKAEAVIAEEGGKEAGRCLWSHRRRVGESECVVWASVHFALLKYNLWLSYDDYYYSQRQLFSCVSFIQLYITLAPIALSVMQLLVRVCRLSGFFCCHFLFHNTPQKVCVHKLPGPVLNANY